MMASLSVCEEVSETPHQPDEGFSIPGLMYEGVVVGVALMA